MKKIARAWPESAQRCPHCGYQLSGTVTAGLERCPECGQEFTIEKLWRAYMERNAEPASLSPHEVRVPGPLLLAFLWAGVIAVFGLLALIDSLFGG